MIESALEEHLHNLPDKVAAAKEKWSTKSLDRKMLEGQLYSSFKAENPDATNNDLKYMLLSSMARYSAELEEIKAEAEYIRLNEKLMAIKKEMSMRTAF